MLHFVDFEVFRHDWLCVIQSPLEETETVIVNDRHKLLDYYNAHKGEIYVGYNIREYDSYIFKAILCGFNPYEMNEHIVTKKYKGYTFSSELNKFPLITYDLLQLNKRLKDLEGFQGHSIYESDVDFKLMRELTQEEIEDTIKYCKNDVEETVNLFLKLKSDFDVQMELINEFELPLKCISLTQTQLTAEVLQASKCDYGDDFDITFQPYLENIKKYRKVVDFYKQFKTSERLSEYRKEQIYEQSLEIMVAGCPHTFGWGGAHGALPKYYGEGYYLHIDVHQYYPSLVISNNYFPRSVTKEGKRRYEMMKNESVRLKKFPELKNKRNGYKLCNNKMTGGMKDRYSKLYDPKNNNNICVGGQLAMLLLVEMLEPYIQLIQSNTDGIIVKLPDLDTYEMVDDICYEWECMTGVSLGFDPLITKIYQKDVNNYLFVDEDGKVERKGAYVKELYELDNDLPIVNKAMVEYMVNKTPLEVTINSCDELIMFQKLFKLSGNYDYVEHNKTKYSYKSYRVFASKDRRDGKLLKVKTGKKPEKFANTPDRCFIDNGNIVGATVPDKLDRRYYVELAKERLIQYGLDEFKSQLEFKF